MVRTNRLIEPVQLVAAAKRAFLWLLGLAECPSRNAQSSHNAVWGAETQCAIGRKAFRRKEKARESGARLCFDCKICNRGMNQLVNLVITIVHDLDLVG